MLVCSCATLAGANCRWHTSRCLIFNVTRFFSSATPVFKLSLLLCKLGRAAGYHISVFNHRCFPTPICPRYVRHANKPWVQDFASLEEICLRGPNNLYYSKNVQPQSNNVLIASSRISVLFVYQSSRPRRIRRTKQCFPDCQQKPTGGQTYL